MKALREAGLDTERELKRELNIKPNEALSKQKPRAIISSKDKGVVRHIFDAGVLEYVLFENPAFEFRSINWVAFKARLFRLFCFLFCLLN